MNKNYFTTLGKGHGAPCLPATEDDWKKWRNEPWLLQMCERIRKGDEQLKHSLPVWTPHCAEFKNNHRAIADAVRPLNRLMLDFDEKGHTEDILSRLNVEHGTLNVLLVEESVRGGTHVLVEMPEGMEADEAQELMKEVTGFEPDKAVKDVSRCIYMVPESYTRFVSEKLYEAEAPSNLIPAEAPTRSLSQKGEAIKKLTEKEASNETPLSTGEGQGERLFKGIPYSSIIKEWWNKNGGQPAEGERNVKLHKLAVNLRAICDNKRELLMAVMPRFGLSEPELKSIVDSACKEEPKGVSKMMQGIVDTLLTEHTEETGDTEVDANAASVEQHTFFQKGLGRLPIGLKETLKGVPTAMQMPVLCSVLPIAAAYADRVEVEYCDGQRHHLGLMTIVKGEQASGKRVCKYAVDVWKRQFDEEDALARQREELWKERKKGRKANEKAPEDPHEVIRVIPVTVSCSTLLRRMKNAPGHTLYSFGEELDTLVKTNGAGSWSQKYDVYRMGFDNGEWGQDYNSDQAESGLVRVKYNWTMLGTDGAMRKLFKQENIENGLSSRILLSEMPDSSFARMPKYGKRSEVDEARIQEAVGRLRSYSGFVDTPRLRKAIEQWVEEKRVEAAKDIDRVKDVYRKRAAVIGFRCGAIHFLLSQESEKVKSEKCCEPKASINFALMMADYCLENQIKNFGWMLQKEFERNSDESTRRSANKSVFDLLPVEFTLDDVATLKRYNLPRNSLIQIVSRWSKDGLVEKTGHMQWKKVVQTKNDKMTK